MKKKRKEGPFMKHRVYTLPTARFMNTSPAADCLETRISFGSYARTEYELF